MTRNRSGTRLLLFVVLLLAAACARPTTPPSTPIPLIPSPSSAIARLAPSPSAVPATPLPTATLSPAPVGTLKPTATATAMPSRTPAPTSTSTPTPTTGPTVTPIVLTRAAPTTEELLPLLANYVIARGLTAEPYLYSIGWLADYANYEADYTRQDRDLDGDGQAEILIWAPQAYQAANAFLAVFVRRDGRWQVGTLVWDEYGYYDSQIYPEVKRFGKAQLLVDFRGDTGGTGLRVTIWTRILIRCAGSECDEVWRGTMAELQDQTDCANLLVRELSHLALSGDCLIQESGGLWITTAYEDPCSEVRVQPSVTVRPRTRAIYCWDGQRYSPTGLEQLAPG